MNQQQYIKNVDFSTILTMKDLVNYQEGQVVSRTLSQNKSVTFTLFAFDKGEEISSHASTGDALVYIIDGSSEITIGDQVYVLSEGETIVMPAGIPHSLLAKERFKMILVVIFPPK